MSGSQVEANKAVVTQFFEGWSDGQFAKVKDLFQLDSPWWTLAKRHTKTAEYQLDKYEDTYKETKDGIHFTIHTLTAEDDRVAAAVESQAQFADRDYNNLYHYLFRVVDGKIVQTWVYYDTALANKILRGEGGLGALPSHAAEV